MKINQQERDTRIKFLQETLPTNWIFQIAQRKCPGVSSFAYNVKYECEPIVLELPEDYQKRNFFKKMQIFNHFDLNALKQKLIELENSKGDAQFSEDELPLSIA